MARTAVRSKSSSPEQEAAARLSGFLGKFDPAITAFASAALERMRARLPGAIELVYDNYNALAIGFGPSERTSDAVFSIAVYPRWVSLFFLHGAGLPDPAGILKGSGNVVRHIVLQDPSDIDSPAVREMMALALEDDQIPHKATGRIVIKSVSERQRPRRPSKSGVQRGK